MGQNNTHYANKLSAFATNNTPPPNYDLPPLKFHSTHGENIELSMDGFFARRRESFCKGIVFSHRPVMIGERVCIKLTDMSGRWSGVIRVGFSAHDPAGISHLPKYACPDLTSKPGYWAKAISERYANEGTYIHYFVTGNGDVHFGIGGQDLGVFFSGIDTRQPLWALVDLYGNCVALELVDPRRCMPNNSSQHSSGNSTRSPSRISPTVTPTMPAFYPPANGGIVTPRGIMRERAEYQSRVEPVARLAPHAQAPVSLAPAGPNPNDRVTEERAVVSDQSLPPVRYHRGSIVRSVAFHSNIGRHIRLEHGNSVAKRLDEEFAQGYVFTANSLIIGERMVLQVLATEDHYVGSLAFGLTNCDPATLNVRELPEDSDLLLDRPEYWVVSKDVANCPSVGDELSFQVNGDGSVEFSKNGQASLVFMHVDCSLPLWAFWDVYGHTSQIRLVGCCARSAEAAVQPLASLPHSDPAREDFQPQLPLSECTICFEKGVDCVLYTCGHMCMCFECALQQWKGRGGGFCPICRNVIKDVIRTFHS